MGAGGQALLPGALESVERALADLRRGATIILHGRGEAHFVLAAEAVSPEALARLGALGGESPSLVVTARRAEVAGVGTGASGGPSRAVVVRLSGGVSAADVRALADPLSPRRPTTGPEMPRPVAVAPAGAAAEAAIELVKLARLLPAGVLAPVPGRRLAYLSAWAAAESLFTVEHDDVIAYRIGAARSLRRVGEARVPLAGAEEARIVAFRPHDGGREHLAVIIGAPDTASPVLVRVHSECFTGDLLASLRCDCGDQLRGAIAAIRAEGAGILLYLAQEGRGIGLVNKLRAYALQDEGFDTIAANEQLGFEADERVYLPAAMMLRDLGVAAVRLMTNNPAKVDALAEWGIAVVARVPHRFPSNPHNAGYLETKRARAGHLL